jgi:hypothetical protein
MHGLINVKFPNNTSKWQMGFNSGFKGLISWIAVCSRISTKTEGKTWFNESRAIYVKRGDVCIVLLVFISVLWCTHVVLKSDKIIYFQFVLNTSMYGNNLL